VAHASRAPLAQHVVCVPADFAACPLRPGAHVFTCTSTSLPHSRDASGTVLGLAEAERDGRAGLGVNAEGEEQFSRAWQLARKPSLPRIPVRGSIGIVDNSLAQKCIRARLKKNCFWALTRSGRFIHEGTTSQLSGYPCRLRRSMQHPPIS
jgi:hypothetical protein